MVKILETGTDTSGHGFSMVQIVGVAMAGFSVINIATAIGLIVWFCNRRSKVNRLRGNLMHFTFPVMTFIAWLVGIVAFLVGGVVMVMNSDADKWYTGVAIAVPFYLICGIICCVSPQYCATCHKMDDNGLEAYLQDMRRTGIDLHFDLTASHTERTTRRDSEGRTHTETRTVVTHRDRFYASVPFWIDLTQPVILPYGSSFVRMECSSSIYWCHGSQDIIDKMRYRIYRRHRHLDHNVDVVTKIGIPGLIENLLVRAPGITPSQMETLMSNPLIGFLLAAVGFSIHHALYLNGRIPIVHQVIHKKASLVAPVVDDSFIRKYNVRDYSAVPRGTVIGNAQQADTFDWEIKSYQQTQPMFVNPMPLYVPLDNAVVYDNVYEPPVCYMDPTQAPDYNTYAAADPSAPLVAAPSAPPAPM